MLKQKIFFISAILVVWVVFVNLATATQEALPNPIAQNKCVRLIQTGIGLTYCNISSVLYPNSSVASSNLAMTQLTTIGNGTEFNYSYCYTSVIGVYTVNGYCGNGSQSVTWAYTFKITPNGDDMTTGKGIIYFLFLVLALFVFSLVLYGAIKIPFQDTRDEEGYIVGFNDLKYVKIMLMAGTYIMLMFIVGLGRGITANYIVEIGVYKFFNWLYWIMLSLLWPIMVLSVLFMFILFIESKKIKEGILRGIPLE